MNQDADRLMQKWESVLVDCTNYDVLEGLNVLF